MLVKKLKPLLFCTSVENFGIQVHLNINTILPDDFTPEISDF